MLVTSLIIPILVPVPVNVPVAKLFVVLVAVIYFFIRMVVPVNVNVPVAKLQLNAEASSGIVTIEMMVVVNVSSVISVVSLLFIRHRMVPYVATGIAIITVLIFTT